MWWSEIGTRLYAAARDGDEAAHGDREAGGGAMSDRDEAMCVSLGERWHGRSGRGWGGGSTF